MAKLSFGWRKTTVEGTNLRWWWKWNRLYCFKLKEQCMSEISDHTTANMNMWFFWDMTPCCLIEADNVSEVRTASIIRAVALKLHRTISQHTVIFKYSFVCCPRQYCCILRLSTKIRIASAAPDVGKNVDSRFSPSLCSRHVVTEVWLFVWDAGSVSGIGMNVMGLNCRERHTLWSRCDAQLLGVWRHDACSRYWERREIC
jgi:hypothetical protein